MCNKNKVKCQVLTRAIKIQQEEKKMKNEAQSAKSVIWLELEP